MHLESAYEVRARAHDYITNLLRSTDFEQKLGVRSTRRRRPRHARTFALGISGTPRGSFNLAVRVQNPLLMGSEHLEEIRRIAAREVEIKFIGRVHKLNGTPWYQGLCRPLKIGSNLANYNVTVGTLAAFVRAGTGAPMILSNNHVLANENMAKTGDAILQPAPADQGKDPQDKVGTLSNFVRLKFPGPNTLDCAVAALSPGIPIDTTSIDQIGNLSGVRQSPVSKGIPVAKLGQTTGKTSGTVSAVGIANLVIGYDSGDAVFNDQIEIESSDGTTFSHFGDSGALVVDSDCATTGLLFADTDSGNSYANPIQSALTALGVQLLT